MNRGVERGHAHISAPTRPPREASIQGGRGGLDREAGGAIATNAGREDSPRRAFGRAPRPGDKPASFLGHPPRARKLCAGRFSKSPNGLGGATQ